MLHCCSSFVASYPKTSEAFVTGNIFDSFARLGVPLFLMISGSLFLDERKEITLKGILSKNVKGLVVITVIWSTVYSLIFNVIIPIENCTPIEIGSVFKGIFFGHFHMWYLYMIIGLYVVTPFLKKFVCKENRKSVLFFIAVAFIAQFLTPLINATRYLGLELSFINNWINKFHLDFFCGYTVYFLVGWYIVHIGINKKLLEYLIYFAGVASLAAIILFVHFTGDYNIAYQNIGAPVFFYSVSVFSAMCKLKLKIKERTAKILIKLSNLTFGVYLIHILVLTAFRKFFPYIGNTALYIALCFAAVTCCSFLAAFIISKIPLLKKSIRG